MATKSVYKSVAVKNARECEKLVKALERAQSNARADHLASVVYSRKCQNMTAEQMRQLFGGKDSE